MGSKQDTRAVHESFERSEAPQGSSDRSFGFVFAVFFTVLTVLKWHKRAVLSWPLLGIAFLFLCLALVAPKVLAPLNRLWTQLGFLLHRVTSPVLLGLVFYLVLTPMAILLRMSGRDPMRRKWEKNSSTYWIETKADALPSTMRDQF